MNCLLFCRDENEEYSTSFWSPDGERHTSLMDIKAYGIKNRLKLNMTLFENAIKSIPPPGDCLGGDSDYSDIAAWAFSFASIFFLSPVWKVTAK